MHERETQRSISLNVRVHQIFNLNHPIPLAIQGWMFSTYNYNFQIDFILSNCNFQREYVFAQPPDTVHISQAHFAIYLPDGPKSNSDSAKYFHYSPPEKHLWQAIELQQHSSPRTASFVRSSGEDTFSELKIQTCNIIYETLFPSFLPLQKQHT